MASEFGDVPHRTGAIGCLRNFVTFMESKGNVSAGLRDERWPCESAFLCSIMKHLNALNMQLQGRDHVIMHMYDAKYT